ncbi:MAG: hypothetical protein JST04_17675 [Bdellovibrionales bacterium]|nr:hypothetical protein [Bdellovibrionales bacterium]
MNKHLALVLTSLVLALGLIGCREDDAVRAHELSQNDIAPGTYKSQRCYKNKLESVGSDRWSRGEITFNDNHTGSGHYTIFSDSNCATPTGDKSFSFKAINVVIIDGVTVLKLDQDGIVVDPTWYVPANASDHGYSLDVDYTDGESGPYLFEPTPTDVASFKTNPGQGVAFDP